MSELHQRKVGVLLFENFELLDVFGPAQILGLLKKYFSVEMIGPSLGPISSAQGPRVMVDRVLSDSLNLDIIIVPGGMGTRVEVENKATLSWLKSASLNAEYVVSVCTGAAILARSGLLNSRRATSNKSALEWVVTQGPEVNWVKKSRWVVDGKFWTSSGVSAGIDMTFALVEALCGSDVALVAANVIEYDRHTNSSWDPFSSLYAFNVS